MQSHLLWSMKPSWLEIKENELTEILAGAQYFLSSSAAGRSDSLRPGGRQRGEEEAVCRGWSWRSRAAWRCRPDWDCRCSYRGLRQRRSSVSDWTPRPQFDCNEPVQTGGWQHRLSARKPETWGSSVISQLGVLVCLTLTESSQCLQSLQVRTCWLPSTAS